MGHRSALTDLYDFISDQVLEYMGGGDLLNLLIERDVFPEDFTRFYVAEVSLADSHASLSVHAKF